MAFHRNEEWELDWIFYTAGAPIIVAQLPLCSSQRLEPSDNPGADPGSDPEADPVGRAPGIGRNAEWTLGVGCGTLGEESRVWGGGSGKIQDLHGVRNKHEVQSTCWDMGKTVWP